MTDLLHLADALTVGLRWLYETEQPADAWMQHHGQWIRATGNRHLTVTPAGAENLPVIGIHVTRPTWTKHPDGDMYPGNPLAPNELARLADGIRWRGYAVRVTWNGFPAHTGSIGLAQAAHPSQVAAVERYRAGCQDHPGRGVFCECDAWRAGFRRAVPPRPLVSA